ncbi:hypothetical protein Poly30_04490 [Planctomycetes bacterium Poly30]|uniref:Uncharacterized protein n=1 Tax=Saltatorellus ferox TaxID=2528018 RepID=A0A518ELI6_9BACT|nr:hypothetical protein Poly30_04490 [Planctomycetes bacterium Poly30]
MKHTRISKEEAARLAQRDRNRIIGLAIFAALVGGLYLYSASNASKKRAEADSELAGAAPSRELEAQDIQLIPFDRTDVLAEIKDATEADQELLQTEPLKVVFDYARLQTPVALEAMGLRDLDSAGIAALLADPATHRLEPYRARGVILEANERPRANGIGNDWMGSMRMLSGEVVYFLVANAPVQPGGKRLIEPGDYLRVEGLFYGLHRTTLDPDGAQGEDVAQAVTGPLIVGAKAAASTPKMSEEIARETPSLEAVVDDTIGDVRDKSEFAQAKWELMGKALMVGDDTDWDAAPELDSEMLRAIYDDGDAYRGKPFRVPVSINMDANALGAGDNPLRIEDYTDGWIGNILWKKPAHVVHWQGPFKRTDMLRGAMDDANRYVMAKGYFFRNEVYTTSQGEPARTPLFIMHSVEVFTPQADPSIAWFAYGVLGLTIGLIGLIYFLLRSDKRKSAALYEDMLRRKRARREGEKRVTPA